MSIYEESGFKFDFTSATRCVIHDKDLPHDGNTIWQGVDFRVFEDDREVWIEVKSWSFKRILDKIERYKAQKDFTRKLNEERADEFRDDIVTKFLGTTSYLAWSRMGIPDKVLYIVFLEPPNRGSRPLLMPFQDRLRDQFKNAQARSWGRRIKYKVVDLEGFQKELKDYGVTRT